MSANTTEWTIVESLTYAGVYRVDTNFAISLKNKPNPIHRFFVRLCFGWVWEDN